MSKRFGILIFIFIFLLLGIKCNAQGQYSAMLSRMEKSLFGVDYNTQPDDARLKRIEKVVYGQTSSNPIQQRVSKLSNDLSADLIGQEIKPKKDTFTEDDDNNTKEVIPKADASVNYPIVDKLEQKAFNKEFKTTDINQRLSKLEQRVFNKTYNDDLNSRVERLKAAIMPQHVANAEDDDDNTGNYGYGNRYDNNRNLYRPDDLMSQTSQFQDDGFGTDGYNLLPQSLGSTIPKYNRNNSVLDNYENSSDITVPLSTLEKKVLKKTFPNDETGARLSRLELKIFNSTFADDDEITRLDRVASAYQAKKTSKKYDNNKFSQHTAAAMQVGAILLMILAAIL